MALGCGGAELLMLLKLGESCKCLLAHPAAIKVAGVDS